MSVRVAKLPSVGWLLALAVLAGLFFIVQIDAVSPHWSALLVEIQTIQRELHRDLAAALKAVRDEGTTAAWGLVSLSFFYGLFHAAGPGHGKVVISTYLLTQESQLKRGLILSVVASLFQGLTAIVAVTGCVTILGYSLRQAQRTATDLELISFGLVALVGLSLVLSRALRLGKAYWRNTSHDHGSSHHHAHEHHGHDDHGHHDHGHHHEEGCSACGHAHGPSRKDLDAPLSWRGLAGMIASIGLRPCSGAIVVLLVAHSLQLNWAGIGAVMAMSIGTAITVSFLATLSVYARTTSLRLAEFLPDQKSHLSLAIDVAGIVGGLIIMFAGLILFNASWTAPAHPLL